MKQKQVLCTVLATIVLSMGVLSMTRVSWATEKH
jgi:hypothetical protein